MVLCFSGGLSKWKKVWSKQTFKSVVCPLFVFVFFFKSNNSQNPMLVGGSKSKITKRKDNRAILEESSQLETHTYLHSLRLTWKLPEGLCKRSQVFQRGPGSFHVSLGRVDVPGSQAQGCPFAGKDIVENWVAPACERRGFRLRKGGHGKVTRWTLLFGWNFFAFSTFGGQYL